MASIFDCHTSLSGCFHDRKYHGDRVPMPAGERGMGVQLTAADRVSVIFPSSTVDVCEY